MLAVLAGFMLQLSATVASDTAHLEGGRLVVMPVGISFRIPPIWLGSPAPPGRDMVCGNQPSGRVSDRIVVEPARFPALLNPSGEWKKEFGAVVDSVLPFHSLVAHLGGDAWLGHCITLQMRVYVGGSLHRLTLDPAVGVRVAERYFKPALLSQIDSARWQITRLSWDAWYYDYGGTAHVEFWSRSIRGRDVVIVFLFAPGSEEQLRDRADIMASFRDYASQTPGACSLTSVAADKHFLDAASPQWW
jgi:hypothetical protein